MKSHELAKKLLELEDKEVVVSVACSNDTLIAEEITNIKNGGVLCIQGWVSNVCIEQDDSVW
jgi:carbonic anhydrase